MVDFIQSYENYITGFEKLFLSKDKISIVSEQNLMYTYPEMVELYTANFYIVRDVFNAALKTYPFEMKLELFSLLHVTYMYSKHKLAMLKAYQN